MIRSIIFYGYIYFATAAIDDPEDVSITKVIPETLVESLNHYASEFRGKMYPY